MYVKVPNKYKKFQPNLSDEELPFGEVKWLKVIQNDSAPRVQSWD